MSDLNNVINAGKKKKTAPKFDNFLEAFKDTQTPQAANTTAPLDNNFNFEEFLNQREAQIRREEQLRFESVRREEQIIFSREKESIKTEIETLRVQIQQLAKEQVNLMVEVDKTSFQVVANPGIYHKNFFERLLNLIKLAKKKVIESRTWLQLHNSRSQARSAYWQGVKKAGTSFMLSFDRTVATQAG